MPGYLPQVGAAGLWTLQAPFEAKLLPNISYQCIAIQTLQAIVGTEVDPVALYYTPVNLTAENYASDIQAGASLITLQAGDGSLLYVPSTYVLQPPDAGGVPYQVVVLAINLGAIPVSMDLSYLKSKIASDVQDSTGIQSVVKSTVASPVKIISNADDAATQAARAAAMALVQTDYAQLQAMSAQYQSAVQKIAMLEAYIVANWPPGSPAPTPTPTPAPTPTPTPPSPTPTPSP